jgi:cytochrome c peroxidase
MQGFKNVAGHNKEDIRNNLLLRFSNNQQWIEAFRDAFDDPSENGSEVVTLDRLTFALAEYQRSQIFVDNSWNKYVKQEGDISLTAKKGAELFFNQIYYGGAGCYQCHGGDFFTDESFHNIAVPQIGRGKSALGKDLGRYAVSRDKKDINSHRTPSLLNIHSTAPYSHSGAFDRLDDIIKHHLDPLASINNYDYSLQSLNQFKGLDVI